MRVTVCPKCKSINSLQVVEDVIKYYYYDAETMEYEEFDVGDVETIAVFCFECGSSFEKFLNPEDYVLELKVDGEVVVGSALRDLLSEEEIREILKKLRKDNF